MTNCNRRTQDIKKMKRRKDDGNFIHRFDIFINSRSSIILNWVWKSGLILFLIALIIQNLDFQRLNSEKLVKHDAKIYFLTENGNQVVAETCANSENINAIKLEVGNSKADIIYLRRDVDGLLNRKRIVEANNGNSRTN